MLRIFRSMTKPVFRTRLIGALMLCSVFSTFGQPTTHDRYIDADGARLFVRSVGSGKPLLIVHGGPGMSHDYLAPQLIELLSNDYELIFYDQRASGRSSGVDDTARLTMSQFVRDLEIVRQHLRIDRLNILGHSFGGLLTMYYAGSFPHRVDKLLLLDSSPASWEMNFPYFRKAIAERQTEHDRQELDAIRQSDGFGTDPKVMDSYMKIYFRTFFKNPALSENIVLGIDDHWLANYDVTGNFIWADLGKYDIHDRLTNIKAPVLVMHGDESVISVKGAEAIARLIPGAKLLILKGVGHFAYIEAPGAFSTAVKEFFGR
jgi:proline iminopeptidase